MKARMNLTIDEGLIQQVKTYAAKKQTSVSDLVEEYFNRIIKPVKKKSFLDMIKKLPNLRLTIV